MKFPKKVTVQGVKYEIQLVQGSVYSEDEYGRVSFMERIITIHDQGDTVLNFQVLFHELFHVLSSHYKLDLDTTDKKHDNMDTLACVLIEVMKANKWIKFHD